MGLFDKKYCDICGEKIGLLGNSKLEDGNLCKDCANKLSPFFNERRQSTVEDIKRQLAYREENERNLDDFFPTVTFDGSKKVYIDRSGRKFVVTGRSDWRSGNPDLIAFSQVRSVNTDIREEREEIYYEDSEGNEKSYEPPRYKCKYEFNVTILVDSPWFDEIELELSDGNRPDSPYTDLYREYERKMHELEDILMGRDNPYAAGEPADRMYMGGNSYERPMNPAPAPQMNDGGTWVCQSCGARNEGKFCASCGTAKPAARLFCTNCGWRPADGQSMPKFCPECGKPLQ